MAGVGLRLRGAGVVGAGKAFRKTLCLSLDSRPDYTRALLDCLRRAEGIGDYHILANAEEGADETIALALAVNFAQININLKARARNFSERAFDAIERGFGRAQFVAYVDGNTAVSPDFLRYLEYAAEGFRDDPDVFLVACDSDTAKDRTAPGKTARRPARFGSAVGIWRNRWEWSKRVGRSKGPDYLDSLATLVARYRLHEVYPLVSRCRRLTDSDPRIEQLHAEQFTESSPLVTAVMITGLNRERHNMARIAIECFKAQTYPNRNLLIVNHGEQSLITGDGRIREVRLQKSRWHTVGDLRNLALDYATGDFILNWDDDDWHHPLRMEVQMRARADDTAVLLRSRIHHSLINGCSKYARYPKGAEATILHPRRVPYRYPSLLRGSDTIFVQQFPVRLPIDNDPAMHIRFFHGRNLWDAGHIMGHLADTNLKGQTEIGQEHLALLAEVLPLYGTRLAL